MTDTAHGKGLSRGQVVTSYAISVGGFLTVCMLGWTESLGAALLRPRSPLLPIVCAVQFLLDGLSMTGRPPGGWLLESLLAPLLLLLLLLLFGFLGVRGVTISVRQPHRLGSLVCGHGCLLVYYLACLLLEDMMHMISC